MRNKTWIILAAVAIGAVSLWLTARHFTSAVEVEAAAVEIGPIRTYIDQRAKTRLPETYLITMPYSGRIKPITRTEGTLVRRGAPVAEVVPEDIELAVAEATAGLGEADAAITHGADESVERSVSQQVARLVESMQAMTAAAAAEKQAAQASLDYANTDLERIRELRKSGARTEDELEQAAVRQKQDAAAFDQSVEMHKATRSLQLATDLMPGMVQSYTNRKRLNTAVLRQRQAQIDARLKKALLDRDRGTIASPVDGVVLRRAVSNERPLAAGTILLEIGRLEDLEVEADVLSIDVVETKPGDKVEIYGPAVGRRRADGKAYAEGSVRKIYPAGFTKISSLGVEQQRVKVLIQISDEDLKWLRQERNIGVGYRVRVRIYTAEKTDALLVPRSALFRATDGRWQVYAVRDGYTAIQTVQVGLINDELVEITSGLSKGQQVVLAPESNLEDGTRVSVKMHKEKES